MSLTTGFYMLPTVALIGRPNVGKSTLFNRLTRTRDAIVADYAGLTRDRQYGKAQYLDQEFLLIDTGGLTDQDKQRVDQLMAGQSLAAVEQADVVLLLVDGKAGLMPDDDWIIRQLRLKGKPFALVINKVDGVQVENALADFYQTGAEDLLPISASHGRGIQHLSDFIVARLPQFEPEVSAADERIKMAIVGRPNVGKSTLVNRILGEDRVVVFDMPGTTRDSISIDFERDDKAYTIIDTAGVRRKKNVKETVEKFSIIKSLQAIDSADVVILVIDAQENLVDQDLHLLGHAIDSGSALVIAVNKWDGLSLTQKNLIKQTIDRRLTFIDYAEMHFISALHGSGVGLLYQSIEKAYLAARKKPATKKLTDILQYAVENHQPPMVAGRRIKLRYAHAGGINPPVIVIHGNQTNKLPDHYKRYLEKTFRKALDMQGTPIKLVFKTGDNPYADKKKKRS